MVEDPLVGFERRSRYQLPMIWYFKGKQMDTEYDEAKITLTEAADITEMLLYTQHSPETNYWHLP